MSSRKAMHETALTYGALVVLALLVLAGVGILLLHLITWIITRLLGTGDD